MNIHSYYISELVSSSNPKDHESCLKTCLDSGATSNNQSVQNYITTQDQPTALVGEPKQGTIDVMGLGMPLATLVLTYSFVLAVVKKWNKKK